MELKNQVTSVDLSNKIHELGITTPSIFYREWTGAKALEIEMWESLTGDYCPDNINCYTAEELGEMLPKYFESKKCFDENTKKHFYLISCQEAKFEGNPLFIDEETEADARAKMLIYLKEKNLI